MSYTKNTWVDQEVERPRTYSVTTNSDETITLADSFGTVTELGTSVNAVNMNHIEQGIYDCDQELAQKTDLDLSNVSSTGKTNASLMAFNNMNIISLSGTNPTLTDNRIHKITISGNTTFVLPSGDNTKFHQILVLVSMPTAYTITLGTTNYFYGATPNMSTSGDYTLLYEYNGSNWFVGAMYKG